MPDFGLVPKKSQYGRRLLFSVKAMVYRNFSLMYAALSEVDISRRRFQSKGPEGHR